jgi:4-amino-4-deoxy-L-arabinose transferase-like glycosyltransferase
VAASLTPASARCSWRREWRTLLPLAGILVAVAVHYGDLRRPGLATGDEALTALRTRGLVEEGHWWTPFYNGAADVHKPPLYYWLAAICGRLTGELDERAVRLPSAASFLGLIAIVHALGRRIYDPWTGLTAAAAVALHPLLLTQSRVGMLDTTMTLFTMAAALFLLKAAEDSRRLHGWGLCVGLALLAKGEAATPVLPASLLFLAAFRRDCFRTRRFHAALLLALTLPAVWFGSQYVLHRAAFLKPHYEDFVRYRFRHDVWRSLFIHRRPLRHLWASWGGMAPLIFAAPFLPWAERPAAAGERRQAIFLLYLLLVTPLLMAGLVRQEKYWYCIPAVAPAAIFGARAVTALWRGRHARPAAVLVCVLLAAGTFLPAAYSGRPFAARGVRAAAAVAAALLAAGGTAPPRRHARAAFLLALALAVASGLSPRNEAVRLHRPMDPTPYRALADTVRALPPTHHPVVVNFRHYPLNTFMFYARCHSVPLREFSRRPCPPGETRYGVLVSGCWEDFLRGLETRPLATLHGFDIVRIANTSAAADIPPPAAMANPAASEETPRGYSSIR